MALAAGVLVASGGDSEPPPPDRSAAPPQAERARSTSTAARLSLTRRVGQLLVMSFDGAAAPEYIVRRLRSGEGTGVILFAKNAPDEPTLRRLTRSVQRAGAGAALVATDQEGGDIRTMPFLAPERTALRAAGVNVNLAPVVDVASVPGSVMAGRAFAGDAAAVSRQTRASLREHSRARVGATVKHFPGLGRATENTDDTSVTVPASRAELERTDLGPFRAAIAAGAPLVMSSHALYPAFDGRRIASQSSAILTGLLRRRLRFDGTVVSDSIEAQAVLDRSGVAEAAERSVRAGTDLILMTGSGSFNQVQPRLLARARRDPRFRARVTEAADRVLALKRRLGLRPPPRD